MEDGRPLWCGQAALQAGPGTHCLSLLERRDHRGESIPPRCDLSMFSDTLTREV